MIKLRRVKSKIQQNLNPHIPSAKVLNGIYDCVWSPENTILDIQWSEGWFARFF